MLPSSWITPFQSHLRSKHSRLKFVASPRASSGFARRFNLDERLFRGVSAKTSQFVGWAKRKRAHPSRRQSRIDGGHGALRLCPPYELTTPPARSCRAIFPTPAAHAPA